jgi:hypothetical protein
MKKNDVAKLFLLMCLLAVAGSTIAGIYRWVDESGQVQYGDRPPPEAASSDEVIIRNQGATSDATAPVDRKQQRDRLLQQYESERKEKKAAAAKKRKEKKQREARCNYAKNRLTEYLEHGLLYERLPNQERKYLSDQQRDAAIADARADVKKWCK